jgi:dihydroxyacetone kinase-like protein
MEIFMKLTPLLLADVIQAIADTLTKNSAEMTALDQAIGDGDHLINLQRGIDALMAQRNELITLDWPTAWQKIGMILMTAVGGAAGSLYGTLFISMSKAAVDQPLNLAAFAAIFAQGVEAVKHRGKADAGEKTLLDVLIPVAHYLQTAAADSLALIDVLEGVVHVATVGVESTRDMLATKGRASFLGARTLGHIDAGAKSSQLMIAAIVDVCTQYLARPS